MAAVNPYNQYFTVDPNAVRDWTWQWVEFTTNRSTSIASVTLLSKDPDGTETLIAALDDVTVVVPAQIDGTDVVVRLSIAADVNLTCRAEFTNGESEDWTYYITVRDH